MEKRRTVPFETNDHVLPDAIHTERPVASSRSFKRNARGALSSPGQESVTVSPLAAPSTEKRQRSLDLSVGKKPCALPVPALAAWVEGEK